MVIFSGPQRQNLSRPKSRRIVTKTGEFNIESWKSNKQTLSVFSNWFITIVKSSWRWTLLSFFVAFSVDWLCFGFIYWVIAYARGDLTEDHLPYNQNGTWTPCVKNIYGFTSTVLFSIEVHTTVAYGRRSITLECPETIITMCFQCIVSSFFQAFMVGVLFAKLTRPKSRTQTILFSKQIIVSLRNDKLCLAFRVGDIWTSRILNIKASVFIMRFDVNDTMLDDYEQVELKVAMDGCESTFFLWPLSIVHVIDETSPFYNISAADLICGKIELLAVFEGLIESTGQPIQAKTSYTTNDILWGHKFVPIVSNDDNDNQLYDVDFSKLSETIEADTPLCSASEYKYINNVINSIDANLIPELKFG